MNQQENREIRISPDALIALVVAEAEDRELSAMPSLEEMNAAFHPSEEFQKKMDRLLKQAKRKQERKGAWRATKRLFVVATTVVTAFACILMPVQAVQEAVVSTVLNWRDQFVEILYSKEDDPNAVILLQNVELTYLPEAYPHPPYKRYKCVYYIFVRMLWGCGFIFRLQPGRFGRPSRLYFRGSRVWIVEGLRERADAGVSSAFQSRLKRFRLHRFG